MQNKIKGIVLSAVFASALVPLAVSAQLDVASSYNLPSGTISGIVGNFLIWLLGILGVVGIIAFVISGIIYLVSAGDETTIERAKRAMLWSIVGIVVGLGGFVIMQAVFAFLSGSNNQF